MRLHVEESGRGRHVVVLLHGFMGSAESWWRVAPLLAGRGRRVLAVDLPGHGRSPRDASASVESASDDVVETVRALAGGPPDVAVGHSFGGTVLAAASDRLGCARTVYVEAPFTVDGAGDGARDPRTVATYEAARRARTVDRLRRTRPHYGPRDRVVEVRAAERFDPVTGAALVSEGGAWAPEPGSILVRADPSAWVTDDDAARWAAAGVDVRGVPGAEHSVWYSHFDEFVAALPEVFAPGPMS